MGVLSIFYTPQHPPLPATASSSSLYLLVSEVRVQTDDMEKRWIPTYNVTPTLTRPSRWRGVRRPVVDHTDHHGGTQVRIFSHTLFTKKQSFKHLFLLGPFLGPAGLDAKFSNPSPKGTQLRGFPRLSTAILTKGFNQALPTSNVTPTPTPFSDTNRRLTYPRVFSCLSTSILSILTKDFTHALPTTIVTPTPTPRSDTPRRLTCPRICSRLSTSILKILNKDFT